MPIEFKIDTEYCYILFHQHNISFIFPFPFPISFPIWLTIVERYRKLFIQSTMENISFSSFSLQYFIHLVVSSHHYLLIQSLIILLFLLSSSKGKKNTIILFVSSHIDELLSFFYFFKLTSWNRKTTYKYQDVERQKEMRDEDKYNEEENQ